MDYLQELKRIAEDNNLELTENAPKIAKFREKHNISLSVCPCEQSDTDRGCIGKKCWEELRKDGICLCHCFKVKK